MDQRNAIRLLNDTFNNTFEIRRFTNFIKELFNHFTVNQRDCTKYIAKEYQEFIASFEKLGDYENSKKEIEVLIVGLNKTSSRDRARTMQRNFIANWLGKTEKDAALVAFYGDDLQDWRFSFVKMEYNLVKDESGKVKVSKELTPAKRYSFLVGVNEPNHTCRRQFLELVKNEEINPSISDIEQAFSIENVTKEFFLKYKELFLKLEGSLQKVINQDPYVKKEFEEKNISTVDFSKKLLGQIVFIYFLQKKGWLGVRKDDEGRFKKWGTGPKNFLRRLFDKEIVHYDNFFNDMLEPLFYEALANDRSADNDYYSRFKCKIPFLNGGLFEPINDYDWTGTDIKIPNNLFSNNVRTQTRDIGTGILNVFDQFNFTVKEDEPLEKEVAVDPEMLGKVFENLLEVKDRKSKGAFYTPREIVHYMCQQSLINYLETNTSIGREDIEKLIQLGDFATSNDSRILAEIKIKQDKLKKGIINAETFQEEVRQGLNKLNLPKQIVGNKELIDELLKEIKIVDPAVGSGAFPIGMLNEIVKARSTLSIFFEKEKRDYDLKREAIENCLYGVDIEPSAVDITKLRFWLSLIVDELDMKNIKPLPNLDHKIMCGNSLLEEFEGIKLFDEELLGEVKKDYSFEIKHIEKEIDKLYKEKGEIARGKSNGKSIKEVDKEIKRLERKKKKILSGPKETSRNLTLDESMQKRIKESKKKLAKLKQLQKEFFNEQNRNAKKQLRADIEKIEWELIEETLKEQGNEEAMQKLEQYKKNKSKPFFLWKLYFAEVFQEKGGFDVIIANPPYISHDKIQGKNELKKQFKSYEAFADIYCYFIELALTLENNNGLLCYITSNSYLKAKYGLPLRNQIRYRNSILEIINIEDFQIFDEAIVNSCITMAQSGRENVNSTIVNATYTRKLNFRRFINQNKFEYRQIDFNNEPWSLMTPEQLHLKLKMQSMGDSLGRKNTKIRLGLATGANHAFIIDCEKRNELINKDKRNEEIIKPILRGRDIFQYNYQFGDKYIILSKNGIDVKHDYPIIYEYLDSFGDDFKNRGAQGVHWTNLRACAFFDDFKKDKIIWIELTDEGRFALCDQEIYLVNSAYFLLPPEELNKYYLLGILNSKAIKFFLGTIAETSGMGTTRWINEHIKNFPIPSPDNEKLLINAVKTMIQATQENKIEGVNIINDEIDRLVYNIYNLTPEEIKIVEEFNEGE